MVKKTENCSICRKAVTEEVYDETCLWGNNAEPVNDGRCCTSCNYRVVIPCRIYGAQMAHMGRMTSELKAEAARKNGKKGGRPKKAV